METPSPGNTAENLIGFSRTKRAIALKLGVDPNSTNEIFQRELNKVAWPAFTGGFIVDLGMHAVGCEAGLVLSAANWTSNLANELRGEPDQNGHPDSLQSAPPQAGKASVSGRFRVAPEP